MKTVQMKFEKETKNTYRYEETGTEPVIGTLYVKKSAFEGDPPQEIVITVTKKKEILWGMMRC